MSARIIPLPTAAVEPVRQHARRGRWPAMVTRIQRGNSIKIKKAQALEDQRLQKVWELGFARGQYLATLGDSGGSMSAKPGAGA